jgi:hypothetical protein
MVHERTDIAHGGRGGTLTGDDTGDNTAGAAEDCAQHASVVPYHDTMLHHEFL